MADVSTARCSIRARLGTLGETRWSDGDVLIVPDSDIEVVTSSATGSGPDAEELDSLRADAVHAGTRCGPGVPGV